MSTDTITPSAQVVSSELAERLLTQSFNREVKAVEHESAVRNHHAARADLLDQFLDELVDADAPSMLAELRAGGFLWSDVAKVVGVSDTAIRKWRGDGAIEPEHHQRVALLLALQRLYGRHGEPGDATAFAERMQSRMLATFSATPLQLLAINRDTATAELQPLLDWLLDNRDGETPEALLDRSLGSAWRRTAQAEQRFTIVTNANGERILLIDG